MTLLLSLAVGLLFGSGAYLLLKRDLLRVAVGTIMISNAANLMIMAAGLSRGRSPIHPLPAGQAISDPLVQALTLTAIVITFGVSGILLSLAHRVRASHQTIDLRAISDAEVREELQLEQEQRRVQEVA